MSSCSIKAGVLRDALLLAPSANAAVKTTGGCLSGIRRGFCRTRGFCISDDCLCGTDVVCATIKRRKLIWICSVEKGCTNYSLRVDLGLDWCPNTWIRLGSTGSEFISGLIANATARLMDLPRRRTVLHNYQQARAKSNRSTLLEKGTHYNYTLWT